MRYDLAKTRKYLPHIAFISAALLSMLGIYMAINMLVPEAYDDVEDILISFKPRSKLCNQPLPTLDSYKARYSTEKIAVWLWNYVKLHREIMCADSPTVPRRFVVYHASAGLANRMQSLFSTFIFAVLSDRALIVDWRPQPKSHTCYVANLFDFPDFDWSYNLIRPLLDDPIIDEHSIRLAFDDPMLLDPFLCSNVSEYYRSVPVINLHTDEYYTPMFEHGYYHDTLREVFGDREIFTEVAPFLFRVLEEIKTDMDKFVKDEFGDAGCALGLQVRQDGIGGVNNTKAIHWSCGQELLSERSDLSEGKIFLASDVQKTRAEAKELYGDRVVYYPVPVRHQEDQTCEEVKAALIDLLLLTQCKALVVSSWSSLGAVAHSISGVKPMIAIYKPPGADEVASIKESEGHPRNYCHQVDWSRPCFFEWVHVRHLSCFSSDMFTSEPCCELGFCRSCLHHERLAVAFLSFYHWPASKIMFVLIFITLVTFGTYRSLLRYFIRRNNYRVFARNLTLGVLLVMTLVWLLLVTIVRSEYDRNISKHYHINW